MDIPLSEDTVVASLWSAYRKTIEYRQGSTKAIPAHHLLVEKQERNGLRHIYISSVEALNSNRNARLELKDRNIGDWLEEWKKMHHTLFRHILKECGDWRKIEVRFGNPGDEELHHIPPPMLVPQAMNALARMINELISVDYETDEEKYQILAKIHYQFIRIHPFGDGNGRIARAIIDQLSVFFGFPPAMAGYPRHDRKTRDHYHQAIRSCVDDPSCSELTIWIRGYIEEQLKLIA